MRRLLYVPLVGSTSVASNEGYREFYALTEALRASDEKAFWYVVIPSWVTDGIRGHDRMQYVYLEGTRDVSVNDVVGFPSFELAQYFARRGGRYIVDGVLTNCVQFSLYLQRLLSDPAAKFLMPVFVRDHDEDSGSIDDSPFSWLMLAMNYIGCYTAIRSRAERRLISRFVNRYANPSLGKLFVEQSIWWPRGYDIGKFDRLVDEMKRPVRPMMFCGGDFSNATRKKRELEIGRYLLVAGASDVSVTSWSARYKIENALPKKDSSFIKYINAGVSKDTYLREVARSQFFVSTIGEYDILAGEEELSRLLLGQVGVFPYIEMIRERLGKKYPFYYNSENQEEAMAMAAWVVENYGDAKEQIKPIIARLRKEHNQDCTAKKAWEQITKKIDETYVFHRVRPRAEADHKKQSLFFVVYNLAKKLGDEFSLDVFLDILEEHVTWLKPWSKKGTLKELGEVSAALPTLYDIRQMLDNLGWVDQCTGVNIMLRREREPWPQTSEMLKGECDVQETS